jgi:uncharacterized protein (DUF305 family)
MTAVVDSARSDAESTESHGARAWPMPFLETIVLLLFVTFAGGMLGWWLTTRESFNRVDMGFMADMTSHHWGAINLSFEYLPHENDSVIGTMAREIVIAQSAEISVMARLLGDAGDDADPIQQDDVAMEWMGASVPRGEMPGMPDTADHAALEAATGVGADDLYSRLMIAHHAAGAEMAEYAVEHGENDEVREWARRMARGQRSEIVELNTRRRALGLAEITTSGSHELQHDPAQHS